MNKQLPKHVSYSAMNTWLECGWKYYLTKIEEVPEGHAVWFTGGSAVHKATERFDKGELGETNNLDELWNDTWFKQVKEELKKDKVYQTARGPATWNGTDFVQK